MRRSAHVDIDNLVHVQTASVELEGNLHVPAEARGLVIFAHGSGSSRHSPRNRFVADHLNEHGFGTLLIDLLTPGEEAIDMRTRALRFDIGLLAQRIVGTIDWAVDQADLQELPIGLFGASTGAAAALLASADRPHVVHAVVSRGGRPDLSKEALHGNQAPTLLIVGGDDGDVIDMNRVALNQMPIETKKMEIIPGATHLFEEPGKLEQVARLASDWFGRFLIE